jgi:hypothetical protein
VAYTSEEIASREDLRTGVARVDRALRSVLDLKVSFDVVRLKEERKRKEDRGQHRLLVPCRPTHLPRGEGPWNLYAEQKQRMKQLLTLSHILPHRTFETGCSYWQTLGSSSIGGSIGFVRPLPFPRVGVKDTPV